MKVGIIIHSHTGNTLYVAEKLKEELSSLGHSVNLERVVAENEDPNSVNNVQLKIKPEVKDYDVIIFGAPVRAFSLSPAMKLYLEQLPSLKGKKIGCYVTQHLKHPFLGGNRSIKQMSKGCEAKDGLVIQTGIVGWSHSDREKRVDNIVNSLCKL